MVCRIQRKKNEQNHKIYTYTDQFNESSTNMTVIDYGVGWIIIKYFDRDQKLAG